MTFTSNMPSSGQSLGFTRPLVEGNFTALYNTVDENHYPPNDPLDGKHRVAVFPEQTVFPATIANESEVFSREFNSRTELMYRPENTAAGGDQWALSGMPVRAGCMFDGSGAVGAMALLGRSFNMSVVKNNSTTFTCTFTTQFPIGAVSANYLVLATGSGNAPNFSPTSFSVTSRLAASFVLTSSNPNPSYVSILVLGG